MKLLTQRDADLSFYFDIIDESEAGNNTSSLKQIVFNNHAKVTRGVLRGYFLPPEKIFGFRKSFNTITKGLCSELAIKTSKILYTMSGDKDVNVTIDSSKLHMLTITPSAETQRIFNESITKSFTLSFESWTTYRRAVNPGKEFRLDIRPSSHINTPIYSIAAHQKT